MSNETLLERRLSAIYSEGREFVKHEDDLVDRRLKWVITISGFLFAAYGGSLIATAGEGSAEQDALSTIARCLLGTVGVLSALIGASSIHAAHMAIKAVTRKYNRFLLVNRLAIKEESLHAWQLIGDRTTHMPGFYSSLVQPYLIAAAWFVLIATEAFLVFGNPDPTSYFEFSETTKTAIRHVSIASTIGFLGYLLLSWKKAGDELVQTASKLRRIRKWTEIRREVSKLKILSDASFEHRLPVFMREPQIQKGKKNV